jgi:tRNA pseudouridine55 synthase
MIIDKPVGPTSMQVCSRIRWLFKQGGAPKRLKVGHGGTLDPLATGVLVVLVGRATRLCDKVMVGEKEYLATIDLSGVSATDDAEGPVTGVEGFAAPTRGAIESVIPRFIGDIQQAPPAFSAVHIGGVRAYDLARRGKLDSSSALLGMRSVRIEAIRIVSYEAPVLTLHVTSGKGVYIRSLARDLGRALGVGGYLTGLRRTRVGRFAIEEARPFAALPDRLDAGELLTAELS